jgi:uncharacterized protein (TIGR02145 family)
MPGQTLLILLLAASPPPALTDPRDGARYRVIEIGGLQWMAENLRFGAPGSTCYDLQSANCPRLGRLYDFEAASRSCPPGWRLPSDDDWKRLEMGLGASAEEVARDRGRAGPLGDRLKVGGDRGFDALMAGYYDPHDQAYQHEGRTAAFWASTLDGADEVSPLAWHRDVDTRRNTIWRSKVNVTYKLPVRCVSG